MKSQKNMLNIVQEEEVNGREQGAAHQSSGVQGVVVRPEEGGAAGRGQDERGAEQGGWAELAWGGRGSKG